MADDSLLVNVGRLGLPMLEVSPDFDAHQTLAEVVRSGETRLWEGFPVLLVNVAEKFGFDFALVDAALKTTEDRKNFHALVLLSLAMYQFYHLSFAWANQVRKGLQGDDLARLKELRDSLLHNQPLTVDDRPFDPSRLKVMFNLYLEQNAEKARQLKEKHGELSLEYALSQVFSPKQKELFKKKLEGTLLTKTEKEYYSRTVRKKVAALANPELHRLAQKLMNY